MWNKFQTWLIVLFSGFSIALFWRWMTGNNFHAFADAFTYAVLVVFIAREKKDYRQALSEALLIFVVAGLVFTIWAYLR